MLLSRSLLLLVVREGKFRVPTDGSAFEVEDVGNRAASEGNKG